VAYLGLPRKGGKRGMEVRLAFMEKERTQFVLSPGKGYSPPVRGRVSEEGEEAQPGRSHSEKRKNQNLL